MVRSGKGWRSDGDAAPGGGNGTSELCHSAPAGRPAVFAKQGPQGGGEMLAETARKPFPDPLPKPVTMSSISRNIAANR